MKNQLATAIAITATAFENTLDKGGSPYILHCLRVMDGVNTDDEELKCIAVMHDLKEDFPLVWTTEKLYQVGFSRRIIDAVDLLAHNKDTHSYDDYIKRIATNKDAIRVKLADLRDNSNITRLKGLRKSDFDRIEKYHKAYVYLSSEI